jgi:O-antigen/teichoic acid export membrane protein
MQRVFFSNLVLMIFLNLLIKPLALFGIDATVQNRVGAAEYGLYFSLLNFSVILNMLLDLGINNYTIKSIAQNPEEAKTYFGKMISFRVLLFVLYLVLVLTFALFVGYDSEQLYLLGLLGINQFLMMTTAYCRSHFSGFHFFKYDALMSVLDRTLLIIFGGAILFIPQLGFKISVELFIWVQMLCYGITLFVALTLLLKHIERPFFKWNLSFSFSIVKQSIPYALLVVLMLLYTRIDGVMLERIHPNGAYESGIYAQGFRLLDALFMFGMIFVSLLFPMFSKQLKESRESIVDLLSNAGNLLMGGSIVIVFIAITNGYFLLNLVYDHAKEAVPAFQCLMLSFLSICLNFIFGTLLTANGNLRFLNISSLVGIIINVIVNFFLIPEYGALGAAFTAFITQSLISILQFVYCMNLFQIKINWVLVLRYCVLIFSLLTIRYLFKNQDYVLFIQMISGALLLFLLSFIQINALKSLLIKTDSIK